VNYVDGRPALPARAVIVKINRAVCGRWVHSTAPDGGRRKTQHVLTVDADWDDRTGSSSRTVVGPDEALEFVKGAEADLKAHE